MSKLPLTNVRGERVGEVELADGLLVLDRGDQAVHDAVVAQQAARRAGTAHTLGKGAVAGSNKKPWKQKGTGRARAGCIRSPVWRGGGVAHGPHPRDFAKTITKKTARLAFARAFSAKVSAGEVIVLDVLALPEAKTKHVAALQKGLKAAKGLLIVTDKLQEGLIRAARNLQTVDIATAADVSTYAVLRRPLIAVTREAMDALSQRLQNSGRKSA